MMSTKKKKARRSHKSKEKKPSKKQQLPGQQMYVRDERPSLDKRSLTSLQYEAASLGIPFGGLTKMQLIAKIQRYKGGQR